MRKSKNSATPCTYRIIEACPIDPGSGCASTPLAIPFVQAVARTKGEEWPPPARGPRRPPRRASRSSPSATCGCTSRATAPSTRRRPDHRPRRGAYVWDEHGNRYLDGLSALFCVNVGHGRTELGEAAARQVEELDFYTIWSYAHPRAIELATRIASLAPGDLNRVFFTSGGSEAVESAIKLARAYHQRTGNPRKIEVHQPRDRLPRHHPRRAGRDRHLGPCAMSSSRWCRVASRCRTPTAIAGRRTATRCGRPTRSRRRSSTSTPTRSPP